MAQKFTIGVPLFMVKNLRHAKQEMTIDADLLSVSNCQQGHRCLSGSTVSLLSTIPPKYHDHTLL
jgi:hypothetical protein